MIDQDHIEPDSSETRHVLDSSEAGGRAIRGGGVRTVGYIISALLTLAAAPLLTRHLGVTGFGQYVVVLSLIGIVMNFSDAGLIALGVREYTVRDVVSRQSMLSSILGMRVLLTGTGVLLAVGFAALSYPGPLVAGTALAGVGLVLAAVQHTYTIPLSAELRLVSLTALELVRQALTVALIVVCVLAGGGLVLLLGIPVPVGVAMIAASAVFLRGTATIRPRLDRAEWRYLGREVAPYAAATAAGALYYKIAIIAMSLIASSTETGYFSISLRIIEALIPIAGILAAAAFPIFARAAHADHVRLRYVLQRSVDTTVILGVWVAMTLALTAHTATVLLGGQEFSQATDVLRVQALAIAATFVLGPIGNALLALRRQRSLMLANGAGVLVAGGLTLLLVPFAGALGAGIAMVVAEFLLLAGYSRALVRHHPDLRVSLRVVPVVAAAAAAACLVVVLQVPEVVMAVLATAIYGVALWMAKAIPHELFDAARPVTDVFHKRRYTSARDRP